MCLRTSVYECLHYILADQRITHDEDFGGSLNLILLLLRHFRSLDVLSTRSLLASGEARRVLVRLLLAASEEASDP